MMECTILPGSIFSFAFGFGAAAGIFFSAVFAKHLRMTLLQRRLDREKKDAIERATCARERLDRAG
jgi:hypothetical protein